MKKTVLKSLATLCAGVMTLCAVSSMLGGCDKYDDTLLKEEIKNLEAEVSSLEARIDALEADLNAKIESLTSDISALATLRFRIVDNKLEYTFDNKEWKTTDVDLSDYVNEPCTYEPCTCPEVTVVPSEDGSSVTIKVGDKSVEIAMPQEIEFEIQSGKLYFKSQETQAVTVKNAGVQDLSVLTVPKGWYAEVDADGTLTVTAPDQAATTNSFDDDYNVVPPTAAANGYVKIHACSADGRCMVGKFLVEVAQQQVTAKTFGDQYEVATTSVYGTVYFGLSPKASFKEDAQKLLDLMNAGNIQALMRWENIAEPSATGKLADLLGEGVELVPGEEYVLWAIDDTDESPVLEDLVLAFYRHIGVSVEEVAGTKTPYDLNVKIDVNGADSYYAVAVKKTAAEDAAADIVRYLGYGMEPSAKYMEEPYDGLLSKLQNTDSFFTPEQEITLLVLPVDGRSNDKYTVSDIRSYEYKTDALLGEGTVSVAAEKAVAKDPYTQITVNVTKPEAGWKYFYCLWMTPAEAGALADDAAAVKALISKASPVAPDKFKSEVTTADKLSPETKMWLVAFFVDDNYKYGKVFKQEFSTDKLAMAEIDFQPTANLSVVGSDNVLKNSTSLEVTTNLPADQVSKYKYLWMTSGYNSYLAKTSAEMASEIHFATLSGTRVVEVAVADLKDGKLVVKDHKFNTTYYLAVLPYDKEGKPGNAAAVFQYKCQFSLDGVIADEGQFQEKPDVTFEIPHLGKLASPESRTEPYYYKDAASYNYYVNCKVTPKAGTEVAVVMVDYAKLQYFGTDSTRKSFADLTALEKANILWTKSSQSANIVNYTEPKETVHKRMSFWGKANAPMNIRILVSWKHNNVYYYWEKDLAPEFQTMYDNLVAAPVE